MNKVLYITIFGMLALANSVQGMEQNQLEAKVELAERGVVMVNGRVVTLPDPNSTYKSPPIIGSTAKRQNHFSFIQFTASDFLGWKSLQSDPASNPR